MDEVMWSRFEKQFPLISKSVCSYYSENPYELVVCLSNGDKYIYDDELQTIRQLPASVQDMDERDFRREFGIRLKKLMFRKNMSQLELSERTGISNSGISRYISGRNLPSFYAIDRIAKALECSADEFRYLG